VWIASVSISYSMIEPSANNFSNTGTIRLLLSVSNRMFWRVGLQLVHRHSCIRVLIRARAPVVIAADEMPSECLVALANTGEVGVPDL